MGEDSWLIGWYYMAICKGWRMVNSSVELQQSARDRGKDSGHFQSTQRVGIPSLHMWPLLMDSISCLKTPRWVDGFTILSHGSTGVVRTHH